MSRRDRYCVYAGAAAVILVLGAFVGAWLVVAAASMSLATTALGLRSAIRQN